MLPALWAYCNNVSKLDASHDPEGEQSGRCFMIAQHRLTIREARQYIRSEDEVRADGLCKVGERVPLGSVERGHGDGLRLE